MRLRVAEEFVETTPYVHELEPVATDRDELVTMPRDEHVTVRYSHDDLSEVGRRILGESTDLAGYDQEEPLSDGSKAILADLGLADLGLVDLGLADVEIPDGRRVASWRHYDEYDDACFAAGVGISEL